ncbi:peroxidase family protein [Actinomadura sp. 7K507]|uniref:peroxidase family protein n=1 Tax=Actinomadura sp. 7K507 TaxID=2530365 RepID=UPI001043F337|nr:peroxidase family protein [Actinomadura sp. 7K507]TDC98075.1 hypothetical protein E1285_01355 [Actinomadura sp. 7K507]
MTEDTRTGITGTAPATEAGGPDGDVTARLRQEIAERLQDQLARDLMPQWTAPQPNPAVSYHGMTPVLQTSPTDGHDGRTPVVADTGYYTRLFKLPPDDHKDRDLIHLGAPCGPMDANPPKAPEASAGAGKAGGTPCLSPGAPLQGADLETVPAGYTYFGQFLDHNITFQADATFDPGLDPAKSPNYRSGRISLEHVYGLGPQTQSFQYYDNDKVGKFWIDPARTYDVPRNKEDVPIIADPRNDNTVITIQLHLAFMKFHNAVVDIVKAKDKHEKELFATAKQTVVWHYQWLVLHDWLSKIIRKDVFDALLARKAKFFTPDPGPVTLPVEFTVAGYRLHSLVQERYRLNGTKEGQLFHFRKPFSKLAEDERIDWSYFFHTKDTRKPQYSKKFDGKVVHTFLNMPGPIDTPIEWLENLTESMTIPGSNPPEEFVPLRSIAVRNLLRGKAFGLPSGQAVAKKVIEAYGLRETPRSNKDLGLDAGTFGDTAPLWYYIMREGATGAEKGTTLGVVGSVIVGEVIFGLLRADPTSFLYHNEHDPAHPWTPATKSGHFTMADLLKVAGV